MKNEFNLRAEDFELNVPKAVEIQPEEIDIKKFRNLANVKAKDDTQLVSLKDATYFIKEVKKCKEDPIYFAEKYFYIVTYKGKEIIKLFDKQREMIQSFISNSYSICCSGRQQGKCCLPSCRVRIKTSGPNDNAEHYISIEDLWNNYGQKI